MGVPEPRISTETIEWNDREAERLCDRKDGNDFAIERRNEIKTLRLRHFNFPRRYEDRPTVGRHENTQAQGSQIFFE